MFAHFKKALQDHIALLLVQAQHVFYVTDVDKEVLWEAYLASFPESQRQEYTCNACKSFIRHYGGLVFIINNKLETIWNFRCDAPFDVVAQTLDKLVGEAKITDVFFSKEAHLGVDSNVAKDPVTQAVTRWQHLFFKLPKEMVVTDRVKSVESFMGAARDSRNVFHRSLTEITLDAIDTVLDLIAQNSLYRGVEYKGMLDAFRIMKVRFEALPLAERELYAWAESGKNGESVARIRNTAIGTLLVDVAKGEDLDRSVSAFERIMAPANYKRPNAIITQKMIQEAEKTIESLGYGESLGRRFASVDDLTVNNLLFVNRDTKKHMGLLADLKETVPTNVKSFGKVDEISVEDFLKNVLPRSTKVEVFFENQHISNLVSLITAKHPQAPSLFKWPNNFSWSYKNAVTDSMKEKVKSAGGQVEGELRVSLEWYNFDDLDLHILEPRGGDHIYFGNKRSVTGGQLDVDMNAGTGTSRQAVENVIWPTQRMMKEGRYSVNVNQFTSRERIDIGFSVEIECQGQVLTFGYDKSLRDKESVIVAEFDYSKSKGLTLVNSIGHDSKVNSKQVWGVDTNKFHTASMILQSPNFWDGNHIGNSHLIFVLDQAHNDELARGFFNEFLKPELEVHKRVFEALGSRMKVDPADKQVSGLGFSITQHTDLVVKVDGHFTRTLKIKF